MKPRSARLWLAAWVVLLAGSARAQDPFGGSMFPGGGPGRGGPTPGGGTAPPPKKAAPGEPELHAASGASDQMVAPGSEPTLPEHPLELKAPLLKQIGSDLDPDWLERGRSRETQRRFYGPYYEEESGKYRLRMAFPFWAERVQPSLERPEVPDRASVYGFYYNRRSNERADDILFPLVWDLKNRLTDSRTTVVGPVVHREAPGEHDNWLFPLYFTGKRRHGGYTLIPPLLTYTHSDEQGGFNLIGLLYCSYRGGPSCDTRTAQEIDLGIAPFYFFGQNAQKKYEVIPPLLHYYGYDDRNLSYTNVWGPYYRRHTEKLDSLHVLPLYYSLWNDHERHTTLFPFFHHGYDDLEHSFLHVNPLFVLGRGAHGERTFVTWGYARYRGRTELDVITPLYWGYRDPDIGLDQKLFFPFYYSRTSPRESSHVVFPFYGHLERFGVSETTWITPLFRYSHDLRGFSTSIYPLVHFGRDAASTHTVIAPFYWDFADPKSRTTVVFPFYWRFSDEKDVNQLVGNVYYSESKVYGGKDWQIHIFPLFSYGETPDGHWWNLLYGLAGYTRRGTMTQVRTLWLPITTSK